MFRRCSRTADAPRSFRKRAAIGIAALVQFALLAAAQLDLIRRPASAVRGSKWAWRAVTLVNFAGPIAYFALGRRAVEPALPLESPAR